MFFCALLCRKYIIVESIIYLPISTSFASLLLWESYKYSSESNVILNDMDNINQCQIMNKLNKAWTVCITLWIYSQPYIASQESSALLMLCFFLDYVYTYLHIFLHITHMTSTQQQYIYQNWLKRRINANSMNHFMSLTIFFSFYCGYTMNRIRNNHNPFISLKVGSNVLINKIPVMCVWKLMSIVLIRR